MICATPFVMVDVTPLQIGEPCRAPKDGVARLQMETTMAVLGDDRRYPTNRALNAVPYKVRLLVIFVLLLSACERPPAQTMTRKMPTEPTASPLPAEDIPSDVRESLHPWISGFIGLSTAEATQRLHERWASINHPSLLELRKTLSDFEVRSVVDYGEGGLIYAVRRNAKDEYVGNTFYLPGPLDNAILDTQLNRASHSDIATLREFLQYFAGLAEDTTTAGDFVYLDLPWETFTDSWNGSIEGFEDWQDSLMLYTSRNG